MVSATPFAGYLPYLVPVHGGKSPPVPGRTPLARPGPGRLPAVIPALPRSSPFLVIIFLITPVSLTPSIFFLVFVFLFGITGIWLIVIFFVFVIVVEIFLFSFFPVFLIAGRRTVIVFIILVFHIVIPVIIIFLVTLLSLITLSLVIPSALRSLSASSAHLPALIRIHGRKSAST
jgi:hypothetical protein